MAYVPNAGIAQSPEDEEQQRQQQAPSIGGGGGGGSPWTVKATPGPAKPGLPGLGPQSASKGSGFVNLQSFLTPEVAKQQQQKVATAGTNAATGLGADFDKAVTTAKTAIANSTPLSMNTQGMMGTLGQAGIGDPSAFERLKSLVSQSYSGPMGVDFDMANNANAKKLAGLSNAKSALDALNPNLRKDMQYTQGNRWLDSSLMQSDAGTGAAIGNIAKNAEGIGKQFDGRANVISQAAQQQAGKIDAARKAAIEQLRGIGSSMLGTATQKAAAANAQEAADLAGNVVRDPNTGEIVHMKSGQKLAGWEPGAGQASAGNFLSGGEANNLAKLAELLGDPSLAVKAASPWQGGRWTLEDDLDKVADLPTHQSVTLEPVEYFPR